MIKFVMSPKSLFVLLLCVEMFGPASLAAWWGVHCETPKPVPFDMAIGTHDSDFDATEKTWLVWGEKRTRILNRVVDDAWRVAMVNEQEDLLDPTQQNIALYDNGHAVQAVANFSIDKDRVNPMIIYASSDGPCQDNPAPVFYDARHGKIALCPIAEEIEGENKYEEWLGRLYLEARRTQRDVLRRRADQAHAQASFIPP